MYYSETGKILTVNRAHSSPLPRYKDNKLKNSTTSTIPLIKTFLNFVPNGPLVPATPTPSNFLSRRKLVECIWAFRRASKRGWEKF